MNVLKEHTGQIKKIVGFLLFMGSTFYIVVSVTYLFRGNSYGYNDRISVVGIKEEMRDSIDVIYIGGSAAFVYWEPLKAYQDYGFTSYDLATNTIQAESILAYIKYAQKYQNPDLYIIGVRAFQYYSEQGNEKGLRITSDSMDIGLNRMSLIHKYMENRKMDTHRLALYWDLIKYHTNSGALANPIAWKLIDNSTECDYKGGQIQASWCYLKQPEGFKTEERAQLIPENEETLKELLDYCKKNDLNVLFVVCPYSISSSDYSIYNTIGDTVFSYGYNFINTNDYYKEMGIDFSQDFYNTNHINSLGAEKYTAFLESYLMENYSLPDHRNDGKYAEWNKLAQEFINKAEESKSKVRVQIAEANEAIELGETIRKADDFKEWATLVDDSRYSIIVVGNEQTLLNLNDCDRKLVNRLGMSEIVGKKECIEIITSGTLIASNSNGEESITTNIGNMPAVCVVDITDQTNSIRINDRECSQQSQEGLNIVIFDNYYGTIIDSVVCSGVEGDIHISR